jgi:hypothetical protein
LLSILFYLFVSEHTSPRLDSIKKKLEKTKNDRRQLQPAGGGGGGDRRPNQVTHRVNSSNGPAVAVGAKKANTTSATTHRPTSVASNEAAKLPLKDLLKLPNVDKKMVEIILDEIVDQKNVKFSDVG